MKAATTANRRPAKAERPPSFDVLGTPVSAITLEDAHGFLDAAVTGRDKAFVCVCSVNMVMEARRRPPLAQALREADMVTPDGYPLTRLGQRRATRPVGRVRGTDLFLTTARLAAERGWRFYLYGGLPGVAEKAAARLTADNPRLQIVGAVSPPMRKVGETEPRDVIDGMNQARPDIVWVGLGCPKQELWMLNHRPLLDAPVIIGVGAAFDFVAGSKSQAPRWVQRIGLEWFWRFLHEPRRLWKRVIVEGPLFFWLLARERLRRRRPHQHV